MIIQLFLLSRGRPPNQHKSSLEIAKSKSNHKPLSDISGDKNMEGNRINQSESESLDIYKPRQCKIVKSVDIIAKLVQINN